MAKKRNTIEDYLDELYRRGMAGDEEAQLEYIQFYVMETDMPLPDEAKVWLVTLAEKGGGDTVFFSGPSKVAFVA